MNLPASRNAALHLMLGAFLGFSGVILGAFGTHALKEKLSPEALASFNTGVRYQELHAIVILFLGLSTATLNAQTISKIALLMLTGVVLFSGSIYLVSTSSISGITYPRWFFFITPIGGLLLITGWFWLFITGLRAFLSLKK